MDSPDARHETTDQKAATAPRVRLRNAQAFIMKGTRPSSIQFPICECSARTFDAGVGRIAARPLKFTPAVLTERGAFPVREI